MADDDKKEETGPSRRVVNIWVKPKAGVDAAATLSSAYGDLAGFTDQANLYALLTHTSDEMIPPTRGVDWGDNGVWRTLHAHTWDPTHSFVTGVWNQLNGWAFKCNQIIDSRSNPTAEEKAEAQFLRALLALP